MRDIRHTTSKEFAQLIASAEDPQELWRTDELAAIWRHQLATALEFDLGGLDQSLAPHWHSLCTASGSPARTFADLLFHPAPPVQLLELVKEFAKTHSTHPESLLPRDISMTLYYAAIAAALLKCGQRISSLSDSTLREGLERVTRFPWLEEQTRAMTQAAVELV